MTTQNDDLRLQKLFNKLDVNGDGRISVHDLSHVLTKKHDPMETQKHHNLVAKFFEKSDLDASGDVTLEEFLNYAKVHEKKLKLIFTNIDKNRDGWIDVGEVVKVLKEELGVVGVDEGGVAEVLRR
jgi:solute carrier family 25 phosphate transporter 23/24/25/41